MMDAPLELIVAAFDDEKRAGKVWDDFKRRKTDGDIKVLNAAVLVKDEGGRAAIRDTEDVDAGRGALFGAITGALIGLLGGPAGIVAGAAAGAVTGGVTASLVDMGFSEDQLDQIRDGMPPGSSALVVLLEHRWVERMLRELEKHQARVVSNEINPEMTRPAP